MLWINSWCVEQWNSGIVYTRWRTVFSNCWGLRRFRFAVYIIPPMLNNRSTAADEGSAPLNLRSILRTCGYLSRELSVLSLSSKNCKPCNSALDWRVVLGSASASAINVKKFNVLESTTSQELSGIEVFRWCFLSAEYLRVSKNRFFICSAFPGLSHLSLKAGWVMDARADDWVQSANVKYALKRALMWAKMAVAKGRSAIFQANAARQLFIDVLERKQSRKKTILKSILKSILNYPKYFLKLFWKYFYKIVFKSILKIQNKIVFSILKIKYYFENTIVPNTVYSYGLW